MPVAGLRVRVLGPVSATRDGVGLRLEGLKPRQILALLALARGRVVSIDALLEALWPDGTGSVGSLQVHISALRRALGPTSDGRRVVVATGNGYALAVDAARVDLAEFDTLVDRARRDASEDRASQAAARYRQALGLWSGPALGEMRDSGPALAAAATALEESRLAALEARLEVDLARGAHAELAGEIRSALAEHPLREGLWASLMLSLYRSGRQAEALAAYQVARQQLVDELGIDPGPVLRSLEGAILAQSPALDWVPVAGAAHLETTYQEENEETGEPRAALVDASGDRIPIRGRCTLGRHPDSTIVVDDTSASRHHAEIRTRSGNHHLIDLGSTNGTRVNGRIVEDHLLADGDQVRIGGTVIRYERH